MVAFLGRQTHLQRLVTLLNQARRNVTVGGPPRCGTSRLIHEALTRTGRPYELVTDPQQARNALATDEPHRGHVVLVCDGLTDTDLPTLRAPANRGKRPIILAGRLTEPDIPVAPFSPAELSDILALEPAEALEARLITGGLPMPVSSWRRGDLIGDHLATCVADPCSTLVVNGERLSLELPHSPVTRAVLSAVARGSQTFTAIAKAAGGLKPGSVDRALADLTSRGLVVADQPLSNRPGGDPRYRVRDPGLGFWLRFLGPHLPRIERGDGAEVLLELRRDWSRWVRTAIAPLVREALGRLGPPGAVGGFWRRSAASDVDLVVADTRPAQRVLAIGAIRWDVEPFGPADLARLTRLRRAVPGATTTTPLIVVSRSGATVEGITAFGPADVVAALT